MAATSSSQEGGCRALRGMCEPDSTQLGQAGGTRRSERNAPQTPGIRQALLRFAPRIHEEVPAAVARPPPARLFQVNV